MHAERLQLLLLRIRILDSMKHVRAFMAICLLSPAPRPAAQSDLAGRAELLSIHVRPS
jgi:hypothetical protein